MCDKNKLKKITDDVVKAVLSVTSNVDSIILYGSQAKALSAYRLENLELSITLASNIVGLIFGKYV